MTNENNGINEINEISESKNNLYVFKTPEENLAFALIQDCEDTLTTIAKKINKIGSFEKLRKNFKTAYTEEKEWLLSDEDGFLNSCMSFKDCCDILKWSHEIQRKRVLNNVLENTENTKDKEDK